MEQTTQLFAVSIANQSRDLQPSFISQYISLVSIFKIGDNIEE